MRFSFDNLYIINGYIFFVAALFLNPIHSLKNSVKILPPPDGVEYIHFGFQQIFADSLWLNYIQNNWTCSKYKDPEGKKCPYRWGYKVLKSAITLDPKYQVIGKHGATKLTIIQDDHLGAEELFLNGLKYYPDDWVMNYRLAYLYNEEIKDEEKAAKYFEIAANNGAPYWTKSLASRLYSKAGKKQLSFTVLKQMYDEMEDEEAKLSVEKRLIKLAGELREISSSEK